MNKEKIIKWLEGDSREPCRIIDDKSEIHFIKNQIEENLDAIYSIEIEDRYHLSSKLASNLEGIFNRQDMTLYDYGSTMQRLLGAYLDPDNEHNAMKAELEKEVMIKENEYIRKMETALDENKMPPRARESYRALGATMAQNLYLTNQEVRPKYYSKYMCGFFRDVAVRYILDKEALVADTVEERINYNRSDIEREIYTYKFAVKEMQRLCNGEDKNMTAMRRIMNSIPNYYSNVNVTVNLDRKSYTFKMWASSLSSHFYDGMGMDDVNHEYREGYKNTFGEDALFRPIDVTSITHGRSVLYMRDTWLQNQNNVREENTEEQNVGVEFGGM